MNYKLSLVAPSVLSTHQMHMHVTVMRVLTMFMHERQTIHHLNCNISHRRLRKQFSPSNTRQV